ncbi:phosphodiesterase [Radicibacter daui]|uniref:phosphodiesterase n=1 Tax=Radicibacter daui TaxID=3064829 RepID=UPI004046D5CE
MLLCQISDFHSRVPGEKLRDGTDPVARLEELVAFLPRLPARPDAILITGDLADDARPEQYEPVRAALERIDIPVYAIPGNHDDRASLRHLFPEAPWMPGAGYIQFGVDIGDVRVIGLDSLDDGKVDGVLCGERLAWLKDELADCAGRPVLIALHHPPIALGGNSLAVPLATGADALAGLVAAHDGPTLVVAGHVHRQIHSLFAGVPCVTAPASSSQFSLPLDGSNPGPLAEASALLLHLWQPALGFTTHRVQIT